MALSYIVIKVARHNIQQILRLDQYLVLVIALHDLLKVDFLRDEVIVHS